MGMSNSIVQRRAAPAIDRRDVGTELIDETRDDRQSAIRRRQMQSRSLIIITIIDAFFRRPPQSLQVARGSSGYYIGLRAS